MKQKQFIGILAGAALALAFALPQNLAAGDRCFGCEGGTYVKYTGKADNAARKKAKACGCKVKGTAGCPSNKKKILCTVSYNEQQKPVLVCKDKQVKTDASETKNG